MNFTTGIAPSLGDNPMELGRFNLNGQPVGKSYRGMTVIQYPDGSSKKSLSR